MALVVFASVRTAHAQSCYTKATVGGGSTVTLVSAIPAVGTSVTNVNARENNGLDASSYLLQTFTGPASITVATALVSGPIADNDRAPFGLTFINGSPNAVTVTQVDIISDAAHPVIFRSSPPVTTIDPAVGSWSVPNGRLIRWTGTIVVPAKSAQGFIARVAIQNIGAPNTGVVVGGTITTTTLGVLTATGFPTDVYTPDSSNKVGEGVVAFVDAGNYPRTINNAVAGTNLVGGSPSTIRVRVSEYANNQAIAAGLQLTVTVPAGWTINSVTTAAGAPAWGAATITQPTASVDGSIRISTTAILNKGNIAPDVLVNVTPPVVYTKSTFQMKASLQGFDTSAGSQGAHPIRSVCDGGGTILPSAGAGSPPVLNAEFLSPRLNVSSTSAPVSQYDIRTDFDLRNHTGTIAVNFDAFNFTTSAWTTLATQSFTTATPQYTYTATISGANINNYLDAQSRMRVRYVTGTGGAQTLRIDQLAWTAQLSWAVDSQAGNDNWSGVKFPGSVVNPFQTLGKVATVLTGSEQVQVIGRAAPYAGNVLIAPSAAGTAVCKTLYQGVVTGGIVPAIHGTNPSADVAFQVTGNHAKVDGFTIDNMFVALDVEPNNVTGTVFSNNNITLANGGFGILVNTATSSTVSGNTITAPASGSPFFAIYDYSTTGSVIDGNRVSNIPAAEGIMIDSSASPAIQRNIVTGNYIGVHIARTTGTTNFYSNTIDSNFYLGAYSESAGSIVSRNNILSRNSRGWESNTTNNNVSSNYDDVWANSYIGYVNVAQGANSIAANPAWIQTNNAALATYYKLNTGSPCINSGSATTGLTFLGIAPDMGAVESQ